MQQIKRIGTHSGQFHADDAMACLMLTKYTKDFQGAQIIRTRNKDILSELDLVVDVGSEYDVSKHRYDHHQKGFEETFNEDFETKLSGSGLIFKHFGNEVIKNALSKIFQEDFSQYQQELTEEEIEKLKNDLYPYFFECIDAIDNGISAYPKDIKPKYKDNGTSLGQRVSRLNQPWWDSEEFDDMKQFSKAMDLCEEEFLHKVKSTYASLFICKQWVRQAFDRRFEIDQSGKIIYLQNPCYWKESLYALEDELKISTPILYVIFPDRNGEGYRVQCVSIDQNSFENRKSLHADWRGLEQQRLAEVSKIEDVVFCHHSGFIGGAKSFESTLKMAQLSLNAQQIVILNQLKGLLEQEGVDKIWFFNCYHSYYCLIFQTYSVNQDFPVQSLLEGLPPLVKEFEGPPIVSLLFKTD